MSTTVATAAALTVEDLRAHYITDAYGVRRTVHPVDDVSLSIKRGEVYGIAGESGCGKTTLLKVLLGQVTPPLSVVGGRVRYEVDGRCWLLRKRSPRSACRCARFTADIPMSCPVASCSASRLPAH